MTDGKPCLKDWFFRVFGDVAECSALRKPLYGNCAFHHPPMFSRFPLDFSLFLPDLTVSDAVRS
jgi:hypothetical protein